MADILENKKKFLLKFQIMMVGKSGAGKSSIILRYTQNKFS
jgi:GTPase SAR1 family protein